LARELAGGHLLSSALLALDLCRWRVMPIVSTPRSLDLAHLRTALWFHQRQPLTRFVSLDMPQNQAARELGLPV